MAFGQVTFFAHEFVATELLIARFGRQVAPPA